MNSAKVDGVGELQGLVGQSIGPTDWIEITQDRIDRFAEVSGDHQWIHVDPEAAAEQSPFGRTIAHGDLTLAIVNGHRIQLLEHHGLKLSLNYGWDKVRYPAPVPVDSRIRIWAEVREVDERGEGWWHMVTRFTVERERESKPVFVGDSATRFQPAD